MDDIEEIQVELYKAIHHLKEAENVAHSAGWNNDEGYALSALIRCATALNDSLQQRFIEGAEEYEPSYEVQYLLEIQDGGSP